MEQLSEILLVGKSARTNNKNESDINTAKIGQTIQEFFSKNSQELILNKKNPGTLYSVYTDYESDHTGDYTYFVGEEVTSFENVDEKLATLIVPAQNYIKITTEQGKLPEVVINKWQEIWQMTDSDFGGKRNYLADFEVYDEKSRNPQDASVDIFIGVNNDANLEL
jgi:predicted transcriptional regulator YdeE